jgi:hypothetical protein
MRARDQAVADASGASTADPEAGASAAERVALTRRRRQRAAAGSPARLDLELWAAISCAV